MFTQFHKEIMLGTRPYARNVQGKAFQAVIARILFVHIKLESVSSLALGHMKTILQGLVSSFFFFLPLRLDQ